MWGQGGQRAGVAPREGREDTWGCRLPSPSSAEDARAICPVLSAGGVEGRPAVFHLGESTGQGHISCEGRSVWGTDRSGKGAPGTEDCPSVWLVLWVRCPRGGGGNMVGRSRPRSGGRAHAPGDRPS